MTRRRSPPKVVTQAQMRKAVKALEKEGRAFGGFHLRPDGSVDVLTENPAPPSAPAPPPPEDATLAEIEALKKKHGY